MGDIVVVSNRVGLPAGGESSGGLVTGVRAAMREDPDVILVGEMRDYETIETAITAPIVHRVDW